MAWIKVSNPIDSDLTLQYKGEIFELGAKASRDFPSDVADKWVEIYGFIKVGGQTKDEPAAEVAAEDVKPKKASKK